MILEVKVVSLNTPGIFHPSLQMFTLFLRKEGAANCWEQALYSCPILLNSFRKPTEKLHFVEQSHNKTSTFSDGKQDVTVYELMIWSRKASPWFHFPALLEC